MFYEKETNIRKLREKLSELLQFDRSDLDFGLYRVLSLLNDMVLGVSLKLFLFGTVLCCLIFQHSVAMAQSAA